MTVPPIVTRVGHTGADELRFHGRRVFAELLGHSSVGQMLVLGLTGRVLERDELATIDDIITAMTSTDPRLWPFKVTRLGAAHGVGAYGVAATLVAGEGGMYGSNRMRAAADWLVGVAQRFGKAEPTDDELADIVVKGQGFGVVYRSRDERFEALMRQVAVRGRDVLPFTRLCLRAAEVARARHRLEPHVYLAIAALCLDLGFTSHQIAMFCLLVLFHDSLANATEGAEQQPPILRELPRDTLRYMGTAPRRSHRSARGDNA